MGRATTSHKHPTLPYPTLPSTRYDKTTTVTHVLGVEGGEVQKRVAELREAERLHIRGRQLLVLLMVA